MENTVKKKSGLSTAGMVLGIVGICTSFIPIVNNFAFVLGILAVVFGIITLFKKASLGKAITALILGVLAIVITLVCQANLSNAIEEVIGDIDAMTGEQTDTILENNLDVTLGKFVVIENDYLDETEMKVTLKNKGNESASFSVEIEAINSDGSRITTDTIYASDLGAGQSQELEAFTLVESSKYDALKNATFKVLQVSMY